VRKSSLNTDEIVSLRRKGLKLREIAERAGTSISGVHVRLFPRKGHESLRHREQTKKWREDNQEKTLETATSNNARWTDEEIDFLRVNRVLMTATEIAIALKRTLGGILHKAQDKKISLRN